jgi:hypothetical protein
MAAALSALDRTKLTKLLALLDSDQPGEVANALTAATRLLERNGLRWSEVSGVLADGGMAQPQPRRQPSPPRPRQQSPQQGWRALVAACMAHPRHLTLWENTFLSGLPRCSSLSLKQRASLNGIVNKLGRCGIGLYP